MVKLLHWCALRITGLAYFTVRLGDRLWELGGNLELWCDSITYERQRRARVAQWQRWVDEYAGKPIITMLDEWERDDAR